MAPPPGGMHFDSACGADIAGAYVLISRSERNNSATLSSQKRGMQLPARQLLSAMPKLPRKFLVTFEFKNRRGTMVLSHNFERVYGPDTLKIITAAFDSARMPSRRVQKE